MRLCRVRKSSSPISTGWPKYAFQRHIGRSSLARCASFKGADLSARGVSASLPAPPRLGTLAEVLLEDYALIGDMQAAALVGRNGTIDWLCLPRFDSASCFSALVGDERHGRWLLAPTGDGSATSRRYRPGTLVLETEFEGADGAVRVIDFMPRRAEGPPRLMRIVEGISGRVPMRMELALRPDYGSISPWVERASDGALITAGPDAFRLSTPLPLQVEDGTVSAEFVAVEGARARL
jgi:hypothetical protein